MADASSARDRASALCDGGPGAAARSSVPVVDNCPCPYHCLSNGRRRPHSYGAVSRDSTFQWIPLRSAPTFPWLHGQCLRYARGDGLSHPREFRMQPSSMPENPRAWKPRSTCSSSLACPALPSSRLLCLPLSCAASLQAVSERLPPPRLAKDPSPQSTVPTLLRLRRVLTPAQTVPVCLWCLTSRASAKLSSDEPTALRLLQFK